MMLDKLKKQRQQKTNRMNLRMFPHLLMQSQPSILEKSFPQINELTYLKCLTSLHLNYVVFSYIEALKKANEAIGQSTRSIENIKVGIIGGGVMGRLFLHSLMALQKQGLDPSNISISTRQQEDLQFYNACFKVVVQFDNEKVAERSDILIVTVPATLDNWIITDIREVLGRKINNLASQNNKPTLNPLVYITTSNMTKQKLEKLFDFPVLCPFIRGHEHQYIQEVIKQMKIDSTMSMDSILEQIQHAVKNKIVEKEDEMKQTLNFVFEKYFVRCDKQRLHSFFGNRQDRDSYNDSKSRVSSESKQRTIVVDKKQSEQPKQEEKNAVGDSKKSSINLSHVSIQSREKTTPSNNEFVRTLSEQVMASNGTTQQTFLVRSRKWRMAYNNFIA